MQKNFHYLMVVLNMDIKDKIDSVKGNIASSIDGKNTSVIITKNKTKLIIIATVSVIAMFIFVFAYSTLAGLDYDVSPTEFRQEIKVEQNLSLVPLKSLYAPSTKKAIVFFTVNDLYTGYATEFDTVAYLRASNVVKLKSRVLYKKDEIMVIEVQDIPNEFTAVRLELSVKIETPTDITDTSKVEKNSVAIILDDTNTTYVTSVSNVPSELKSAYKVFAQDDVSAQIADVDKQIAEQEKIISSAKKAIDKIDEKLIDLPDDEAKAAAQTRREKEQDISAAKKKIEELKQQRNTLVVLIQNYENRYKEK